MSGGDIVRHIAWAGSGSRVAMASFERQVEVWQPHLRECIAQFATVLDFGGERLALNVDGTLLAAAAYHRDGIIGYDVASGRRLWEREDLRKTQQLTGSRRRNIFHAARENGPGLILDAQTGATLAQYAGARNFWESACAPLLLVDARKPAVWNFEGTERRFGFERSSFAILSAAFSPDALAVSEACSAVRCIALGTGDTLWRAQPSPDVHCLELGYSTGLEQFVGILWNYKCGGDRQLVRFGPDGTYEAIADLGEIPVASFDSDANHVLTSDRRLFSVLSGDCTPLSSAE